MLPKQPPSSLIPPSSSFAYPALFSHPPFLAPSPLHSFSFLPSRFSSPADPPRLEQVTLSASIFFVAYFALLSGSTDIALYGGTVVVLLCFTIYLLGVWNSVVAFGVTVFALAIYVAMRSIPHISKPHPT